MNSSPDPSPLGPWEQLLQLTDTDILRGDRERVNMGRLSAQAFLQFLLGLFTCYAVSPSIPISLSFLLLMLIRISRCRKTTHYIVLSE